MLSGETSILHQTAGTVCRECSVGRVRVGGYSFAVARDAEEAATVDEGEPGATGSYIAHAEEAVESKYSGFHVCGYENKQP